MNVYMDENARLYKAEVAKRSTDMLRPSVSGELLEVLTSTAVAPAEAAEQIRLNSFETSEEVAAVEVERLEAARIVEEAAEAERVKLEAEAAEKAKQEQADKELAEKEAAEAKKQLNAFEPLSITDAEAGNV